MPELLAVPEILGGLEAGAGAASAAGAGEAAAGAGAAAEGAGAGASAGEIAASSAPKWIQPSGSLGSRIGGMVSDFNDSPVGKLAGSRFGRMVTAHAAEKAVGGAMHGIASTTQAAMGGPPMGTEQVTGP